MPTINVTEGCAHGCVYCYTQGYSRYPRRGRIRLFENIPQLVERELTRKRRKPSNAAIVRRRRSRRYGVIKIG